MGLVASGVACAPSLSTFQPAHVAPKGHFAAAMGFEGGIPVGAFTDLVDEGKSLGKAAETRMLSDDEKWKILDAGVNLVLEIPSIGPHFALAYTPIDHLEVGVRYAGSAWRGGVRYQLLDHMTGPFDLTAGLGVSHFSYEFPISDQIPVLKLDDFSRWQLDIPILIGTSRDFFHVWAGPKVLLTSFETQLTLTLPGVEAVLARFEGKAMFVGGQGGFAVGYRRLFVAVELTLAEAVGTAHLTSPLLNPMTRDTKVSNFTIFPSVGLMGEF